jgi:hypothetical protein
MRLGFIMDQDLFEATSKLSDTQISTLYTEIVEIARNMVGDDVKYTPMYPNFPQQVLDASCIELFLNAIIHYWTAGQWMPHYAADSRAPAFEMTTFKTLTRGSKNDVKSVFTSILGTNASITDGDKKILTFFMDEYLEADLMGMLPDQIPFKEQLCAFVADCISRNMKGLGMSALKTATDILRVTTHLSGGDISLAENTRFKSMPRALRRELVSQLESVINEDDIARHQGKWVTLAHSLHIGEYNKVAPKANMILSKARSSQQKFRSFESKVEKALKANDVTEATKLLSTRPGIYARRLDHLLRQSTKVAATRIAKNFLKVADKVDTRVLLQLFGHFSNRVNEIDSRLVFPKGNVGKAMMIRNHLVPLGAKTIDTLLEGIQTVLEARFSQLDDMGKVYIDPAMERCPIPLNLRSASEGLTIVARGTQMPFSNKSTLRMFIYWVGQDIDLSSVGYDKDLNEVMHIGYTNLRESGLKSCHSGDITRAPNGAAEFIDIDVASALAAGIRYVTMTVNVYSGPNFNEHKKCYAGWMTRSKPQSNEVFDPKTVEQKVDVQSASRFAIPVIFDLQEGNAIWLDMVASKRGLNRTMQNVHTARATLRDLLEGALSLDNKPVLSDLFTIHANARGEIVDDIEDADTVISWDGDVKPSDVNTILSEYL